MIRGSHSLSSYHNLNLSSWTCLRSLSKAFRVHTLMSIEQLSNTSNSSRHVPYLESITAEWTIFVIGYPKELGGFVIEVA